MRFNNSNKQLNFVFEYFPCPYLYTLNTNNWLAICCKISDSLLKSVNVLNINGDFLPPYFGNTFMESLKISPKNSIST